MNAKDILALIQSGVFHGAEALGNPRRAVAPLMHALGGRAAMLGSRVKQAVQSGVYHGAEGLGNPKGSVAALRQVLSGHRNDYALQGEPGLFGKLKNRIGGGLQRLDAGLQNRGFTGLSPTAYLKNLGVAGKGAAGFGAGMLGKGAVGLAGLSAKGLMSGISAGGNAIHSGSAAAIGKVSKMFAALSASNGGLAQTIFMLSTLGKAGLLAAVPLAIKAFVSRILDSNRALGKWNGSIAASFNRLDVARMRSDISTAHGTSGSATELNRQMVELTREFQPIRQQLGIGVNLIGIWLVKLGREAIAARQILVQSFPFLKAIADKIAKEEEDLKKGNDDEPLGNQILNALANLGTGGGGKMLEPGGIPPREFIRPRRDRGEPNFVPGFGGIRRRRP